ncbi:MAG: hypothetical protein KF691_11575 [Phycisphaeraceae bacterium]|nr:hypothetical protein [Phycisphaeraceae bacterium]
MVGDQNSNLFEIGFVEGPHSAHHDDLFVRVRTERLVCDSYYFEIWQHQNQYAGLNAYAVLASAADNWIRTVNSATIPSILHIPFGLNDQSVTWITIELETDGEALVSVGFNLENGYAIDPINGTRTSRPPDLQPEPAMDVRLSRDNLVQALTRFRADVDRELKDLRTRVARADADSQGSELPS